MILSREYNLHYYYFLAHFDDTSEAFKVSLVHQLLKHLLLLFHWDCKV